MSFAPDSAISSLASAAVAAAIVAEACPHQAPRTACVAASVPLVARVVCADANPATVAVVVEVCPQAPWTADATDMKSSPQLPSTDAVYRVAGNYRSVAQRDYDIQAVVVYHRIHAVVA